jgi:hypothetical protein
MKKKSKHDSGDELDIPETPGSFYKTAVIGKYYNEYVRRRGAKPVVAVVLEEDVAAVFKDSKSVNDVLRAIIQNLPKADLKKLKRTA